MKITIVNIIFAIMLMGCASSTPKVTRFCMEQCDDQGYKELAKCKRLSGGRFYQCYSKQLFKEIRCNKTCYHKTGNCIGG